MLCSGSDTYIKMRAFYSSKKVFYYSIYFEVIFDTERLPPVTDGITCWTDKILWSLGYYIFSFSSLQ